MKLTDLEYAKATLHANDNLTCVLCKTDETTQIVVESATANTSPIDKTCEHENLVCKDTVTHFGEITEQGNAVDGNATAKNLDSLIGEKIAVYPSDKKGIAPLLGFIDDGVDLKGFCLADRIVGKACALLVAFAGIVAVHADVLSVAGQKVLQDFGIEYTFDRLVDSIQNRQRTGICPMEQTVANIEQPCEAVVALNNKVKQLMRGC